MGELHQGAPGGFTLIELSIVLVIIGLIVGGVLVGQDLIRAAEVRATVSQIEKYNTAVNTFLGKYGYLPGDIKDPDASNFGFKARGTMPGQGDGNGVLEGFYVAGPPYNYGDQEAEGETVTFWVDLSMAGMIDGGFSTASPNVQPSNPSLTSSPYIYEFFPAAKLGRGNYIFVWSGGIAYGNGFNYFGMSAVNYVGTPCFGCMDATPGLSVQQAFNIDQKMDDGMPQSGNVTAMYLNQGGGGIWVGAAPGTTVSPSSSTCYDNGGNASAAMAYSLSQSNGNGVNCALSFQFQ